VKEVFSLRNIGSRHVAKSGAQPHSILRGDMSVVGIRPPTPDEVAKYQNHYRRRLSIRPGLTGLWQVSGRNQIKNFEDILELDLRYIDEWSLALDVRIIFKTIWITFSGKGAH